MRLNRLDCLPLLFFGAFYFLTCYLGVVLLLWGPPSAQFLYMIYAGVDIPIYSQNEFFVLLALLHLPVVCLGIGYFLGFKAINHWVKGKVVFRDHVNDGLILFCWAGTLLLAAFSVWRGGAIDNVSAWAASYDNWVAARWTLFKTLWLVEFINLYVLLPMMTGLVLLLLWQQNKKKTALLVLVLGLMVTMLLFQRKQPLVYLIIALLPFGLKVMSRGTKNKPWGRIGAGLVTGLLVAYLGLFFAPTLGLSEGTGLTLTRGDLLPKVLGSKTGQKGALKQSALGQNLPKVPGSKTGQEGALKQSALDQFIQNYGKLPVILKQTLFASNSVIFRTSVPAMYYVVTFPDRHPYYGLDVPFDQLTADDNLAVWSEMWPKTPGGSVSAPFQFSFYAQVGVAGTLALAIFLGVLLGVTWAWFRKIEAQTPVTLMVGALILLFAIFLSMESARNSVISSYGLIWGGMFLVFLVGVSRIRAPRR